jgi:hypothetical protein
VLTLSIILALLAISLVVVVWVGTYLLQGYIYTEPTTGLLWQAPVTGILLTIVFVIWALSIALAQPTTAAANPFLFSPWTDMAKEPAPRIFAVKKSQLKSSEGKDGDIIPYVAKRNDQGRTIYREDTATQPRPWQSSGDIIAIEIPNEDKSRTRYERVISDAGEEFISKDGLVIKTDTNGPTGIPTKFSIGRLVWNLSLNIIHLLVWYLGLWLILRFQNLHALGLAIVMWLIMTLAILPMVLSSAAEASVKLHPQTAQLSPNRGVTT